MKVKLVYVDKGERLQKGRVVSIRTEKEVKTKAEYPAAVWRKENPGIASVCTVSDWMEITEEELDAIFIHGEKTADVGTGELCDTPDTERRRGYLADKEKIEEK